jgi:hypothetical protein
MNAIVERLEAVLARLPVLPDRRHLLRAEAVSLAQAAMLARVSELPRARNAGANKAGKEIERLIDLSLKLGQHIYSMHRDALAALEAEAATRHPLLIAHDLRGLLLAANEGLERLRDGESEAPDRQRSRRAAIVVEMATGTFRRLTGRRAARSNHPATGAPTGRLQKMVQEIFDELEIDANADYQLRLLMEK